MCTKGWVEEKIGIESNEEEKRKRRKSDKIVVNSTNEMKIYYAEYCIFYIIIVQWSIENDGVLQ